MSNIRVTFDAEYGHSDVWVDAQFTHKGEVRSFPRVSGLMSSGHLSTYSRELEALEVALWQLAASWRDQGIKTQRGLEVVCCTEYQLRALRSLSKWQTSNWVAKDGSPLKNQLILQRLAAAVASLRSMVGEMSYSLAD